MLRNLATHLSGAVRPEDIACRFGGGELAIVQPETSLETVQARTEDLRRQAKRLKVQLRGEFVGLVTTSIRVAAFPEHVNTAEALLHAADCALNHAKIEGRDRAALAAQ